MGDGTGAYREFVGNSEKKNGGDLEDIG